MNPRISVVTPTHDRKASVLRLLRALEDGGVPPEQLEVLVVADGCSDDTAAVVRAEKFPFPVQVIEHTPARGSAAARNLGAAHARGKLLVFLDDDIEPFAGMLTEHERAHRELGVPGAVVGPSKPVRHLGADWISLGVWAWWDDRFAEMERPGHRFRYDDVFSGNLSLPASFFAKVGGFDPEILCGHDYDLGLRVIQAGGRVAFSSRAGGWHHESRDYAGIWRRKFEEGRGDVDLIRRHPRLWPVLALSRPLPKARTLRGMLRRLAFAAPWLGDAIAGLLRLMQVVQEFFRMRRAWARSRARLTSYAYWRGVASALGSRDALADLRRTCTDDVQPSPRVIEIDMRQGLAAAEDRLDVERPDGVCIRFGSLQVGYIPPLPGAEPLRGVHLRPALATDLAEPLIAALNASEAVGDPDAWDVRDPGCEATVLPAVSVIIPAYNASDTVGEALDSLIEQTHRRWEAIVVDDGSTDETATVARTYAARDRRIRLILGEHRGGGAARNVGIESARYDWLLFLDADDRLTPRALVSLAAAVAADKGLDAVHGGWARVTGDGTITESVFRHQTGDLFAAFSQYCVFPIHTCLVRRVCVQRAGGFDPDLRTCQDWDLWQRVARAGARFGHVQEMVAFYRMRPGSVMNDSRQLLEDGLRVIERGHQADSRVHKPVHADGAPKIDLSRARVRFAAVAAGLLIGGGQDPGPAIEAVSSDRAPDLSAYDVAEGIFVTAPQPHARSLDAWDELWPIVEGPVRKFLDSLETSSGASGLARRALLVLERMTLDVSRSPRPFARGSTLAIRLEVSEPLRAINVPAGITRVHCEVELEGNPIGIALLPACDDTILPHVLADAIGDDLAWRILSRHFAHAVHRALELTRGPLGVEVRRAGTILETSLPDEVVVNREDLYDRVGWTTFLQDLWGKPDWPAGRFYDGEGIDDLEEASEIVVDDWVSVELSGALPRIRTANAKVTAEIKIGGAPVGTVSIPSATGVIHPQDLRSVVTRIAGTELLGTAVREGLLGRSLEMNVVLRERLVAAVERHSREADAKRAVEAEVIIGTDDSLASN